MNKSNIVFQIEYKKCKNKKVGISKWMGYASQKHKADSTSIDEYNYLKDYTNFYELETNFNEDKESFIWNSDGDISRKEVLTNINDMNESGIFWRGFISFPPDFAYSHGLITKADFFSLSNSVIPSLIMDIGLDINNVDWMCTLHRDTNQPHIHFCIYEKNKTKTNPRVPLSCIHNCKSNIGNYLVDYKKFYELRDQTFNNINKSINLKEFNKVKSQQLFSDKYRKELNKMLLDLYSKLPKIGRLQYNSKNMIMYKKDLDAVIKYILLHDSTKYEYANYLKLLEQHQKELNQLYGISKSNKERKYYNDQINSLYAKIGNEILSNFKRYQALDFMNKEKNFLQKAINDFDFKSRSDYAKDETKKNIAKGLYKICMLAGLNDKQIKKVFVRWLKNSKYNFDVDSLIVSVATLDTEMSVNELYDTMKKLGYDSNRYNKMKNKYFYKELNYKKFINQAINHLMYEIEQEEKQIISEMQYELENDYKEDIK